MVSQGQNSNMKGEKWTIPQIESLIDAYKEEMCLYATTEANYHNKHLRKEALLQVSQSVQNIRPTTTPAECQNKFHNLRNQFNIEHAKVRASHKSGTGTENIYQPALWYYKKLFLETFVKPRKSRNSLEKTDGNSDSGKQISNLTTKDDAQLSEDSDYMIIPPDQQDIGLTIEVFDESLVSSNVEQDTLAVEPTSCMTTPPSTFSSSASSSASNTDVQPNRPTFIPPGPVSPAFSISSSSGISSVSVLKSKKKRHDSNESDYIDAVHELAKSFKEPVTIITQENSTLASDPVLSFASFIGSLLRTFQDEELKLELMNSITQMVINAKSTDMQRAKK